MWNFPIEQRVCEVAGVRFGGQPGENPTVLMGTIFYPGQFKALDRAAAETVEDIASNMLEGWEETGIPAVPDIFISKRSEIRPVLEIFLDAFDWHSPFCVDVPESEVRIAVLKYLDEHGVLGRVILNSVNVGITERERSALAESTPGGAIVLGFNPRDRTTDGRLELLRSGAGLTDTGLIEIAREAGITALLLDTAATAVGDMAGENLRAVTVFKAVFGWPTGLALHNTVESWNYLKSLRKRNRRRYEICDLAASALPVLMGADWVLAGPAENTPNIFPLLAFVDVLVAEGAEDFFGVSCSENHPRRRLAP